MIQVQNSLNSGGVDNVDMLYHGYVLCAKTLKPGKYI